MASNVLGTLRYVAIHSTRAFNSSHPIFIKHVIFYSHLSCSLHWIAPLTRRGTKLYCGGADPALRSGPLIRPQAPLLDLSSKTLLNLANATPWNFRTAHLRCLVGCGKQFHICSSFEIKIFQSGPDSHKKGVLCLLSYNEMCLHRTASFISFLFSSSGLLGIRNRGSKRPGTSLKSATLGSLQNSTQWVNKVIGITGKGATECSCLPACNESHTNKHPARRKRFQWDFSDVLTKMCLSCRNYVGCVGRQVKTFTYLLNTWYMDRGGT